MAKVQRSYQELQAEIAKLTEEAEELRTREKAEVVGRIKEAIATYDLTLADLGFTRSASAKKTAKASTKTIRYRDDQGNTWSGRGKHPEWIRKSLAAGKQLKDFLV